MAAYLSLSLLGPFQAWDASGSLQPFRTFKERALLAYLTVENERAHRRSELSQLFWPDRAEGIARNNLRQALYGIRQVVGESGFTAIFSVTSEDVQVNLTDQFWLDLAAFNIHIKTAQQHHHSRDFSCQYCMQHLRDAVEIYHGSFLEDLILDKNPEFQEWVSFRREQYHRMQVQALDTLITGYEQLEDYPQAIQYARRQIQLEELKESLHRRLMTLLVRAGRVSAALEQYEICREKLVETRGISLDEKTETLANQIRLGTIEPGPEPVRGVPRNLPEHLTPFIGREMELAQIAHSLKKSSSRLISLVGPGGVGKTRLAVQAAQLNLNLFGDGVYFIPLDTVAAPAQLLEAIGRGMGLTVGGTQDIRSMVHDYLCQKQALIILDNFEHLVEAKGLLLEILQAAPFVKILLTSRERLRLQAESLIDLHGLPFLIAGAEQQEDGWDWHQARRLDSVQLLLERSSRVHAGLNGGSGPHLTGNTGSMQDNPLEQAAAIRICRLVEGLPLGLELAASWARDLTFAQIADEVQNNLDFLQTSFQDLPERHRSLLASFEHSWDLLAEGEQEVFCKLAVFPGTFTVKAAQAVAGAAFPWIMQLEDKSLVRRVSIGRYDMHPLIRQFAGQKLRRYSRKIEDLAYQQHAQFFCSFLKEREADLKGGRQAEALNEVEADLENIFVAWEWAINHHAPDLLAQAAVGLMFFLEARGRWQEGEERFGRAASEVQKNLPAQTDPTLLAYLLAAQGWFCIRLTRFQQAEELLLASLRLKGDQQEDYGRIFAHFTLGFLYIWTSRYQEALLHLSTTLSISDRIGDSWGVAWSREMLAEIAFESGQSGYQEQPFLETLALFERAGEQRGSGRALNYLGNIAMAKARYLEARTYFEKLLSFAEKLGDVWGLAGGYSKLGQLAAARGEFEQAQRFHSRSLLMFQKLGDQRRSGYALRALGDVSAALGFFTEAENYFHQALAVAHSTHYLPLAQDILVGIAALILQQIQQNQIAPELQQTQIDRTADLLAAVLTEPVGDQYTSSRAARLMISLRPLLSADQVARMDLHREPGTIWEVINDLLSSAPSS